MQKVIFLFLGLLGAQMVSGQEGIKLGLHFTPGVTFALNNEDFDKGETLDLEAAFGFNTGLLVGYGITETFSISTGVIFNKHQSNYIHNRAFLSDGVTADPNSGKRFSRTAGYIRVPILIEISSDPNFGGGFFLRFGPHFDFLTGASYKDERLVGYSGYDHDAGIDLSQAITIYQKDGATGGLLKTGSKGKIFRDFVAGLTLEIGGQIRINDFLKATILVHLEGSSNPEGDGAESFAHNLNRGDHLVTANPVSNPTTAAVDNTKLSLEETPFDATMPNYTDEKDPFVSNRAPTWNVMGGLQVGLIYTISTRN